MDFDIMKCCKAKQPSFPR